ncbi:MAG: glycosyltransferase family 2 protein [Chthoniobacterales bacterium]|nr:glycosyltransferase family 2 protein [Chthoniobacterales bacterium]
MRDQFREKISFGPQPEKAPDCNAFTLGLFVACYNEAENIQGTLETVVAACGEVGVSFEIVVIDDCSRDRSVEIVKEFGRSNPGVPLTLCVNARNEGLANNYAEAAFLCRSEWYRLICGDNVEPKETLVAIFREIGTADLLIPYNIEIRGRAQSRRIISKAYTALVNFLSGFRLHYYNGMLVTRRDYVMRWHSNSHGFGFQADLLTRLLSRGLSYKEIAVYGQERQAGSSSALTFRNFASVAHSLQNIVIRRVSKLLYGQC